MKQVVVLVIISSIVLSYLPSAYALPWILLGTDGSGETSPAGDIRKMYFYNDGVYAYFNETLAGASNTTAFTYVIYLDKPQGGTYPKDYKLIYSSTASKLQKWDGTTWVDQTYITVTTSNSPKSICFRVPLASIANPDVQQNTGVLFVNYVNDQSIGKIKVDLVAGSKETDVGDVYVSNDGTNLYVDIYTIPGKTMSETHLDVSKSSLSWFAPGNWPYAHQGLPGVTYDGYTIPLSNIGYGNKGQTPPLGAEPGTTLYLMVHAVVGSDTAYGKHFKGSFQYTVSGDTASATICSEVVPELPWPTPLVFIPALLAVVYVLYFRRRGTA